MLVVGATSMEGWACCLVRLCRRAWGLRRRGSPGRGAGLGRLLSRRWWRRRRRVGSCRRQSIRSWTRSSRMRPWCRRNRQQYLRQTLGKLLMSLDRMEDGLLSITPKSDDHLSSMLNHGVLLPLSLLRPPLVRSQRGNSALSINCPASSDEDNSHQSPHHVE